MIEVVFEKKNVLKAQMPLCGTHRIDFFRPHLSAFLCSLCVFVCLLLLLFYFLVMWSLIISNPGLTAYNFKPAP